MRIFAGSSRYTRCGMAVFAVIVAFSAPGIARAACNLAGSDFGQLLPNCNGSYCYVISPGQHSPQSLAGTFWTFGSGNPQTGNGADNGAWSFDNWLSPDGPGFYLGGNWGNPSIDGCIAGHVAPGKPAEIMVNLISDEGGGFGFFAVSSARRVVGSYPEFDFTFVAGGGVARDINLVEIPRARVLQSTRDSLLLDGPTLSDVSPGCNSDGSLGPGEIVKGYRIYTKSGTVTSLRTSDGWSAITGTVPLGQDSNVPMPPCPPSGRFNFGYALVFDGEFETAHVGRVVSGLCRYCADGDGDHFADLHGDPECCPLEDVCDCNDANPNVHPGALEVCNGADDNCDGTIDNAALPGGVGALQFDRAPGTTSIDWSALPAATSYDVVRGDLTALAVAGGDYAAATTSCEANDVAMPHIDVAEDPDPGGYGFWYLIRAANCIGDGSYNGSEPSQAASRDPGIAASGQACP